METRLFTNIFLKILLYTTLLSAMFVMPLVLARDHAGMVTAARDAQVWERSPDVPAKVKPHRNLRLPRTDAPVSGPAAMQAPTDKSGPDSAMIKPGRARAKTIRL